MQGARTAAQWCKEPSRTEAQTQHFGCFAVVLGLPLPAQDHVRRGPRVDVVAGWGRAREGFPLSSARRPGWGGSGEAGGRNSGFARALASKGAGWVA